MVNQLNLYPHATGLGKVIIPMQFFGLGDIIFCMQLARKWKAHGYQVLWPVRPEMVDGLNRAYGDVATFVNYHMCQINWNNKTVHQAHGATVIPLRWSYEITKQPFTLCMASKYYLFGLDWQWWKDGAGFMRDSRREQRLFDLVTPPLEPYVLVNRHFRSDNSGVVKIDPQTEFKVVEMRQMEGFSLFDWALVIEKAAAVHTVSTSLLYLVELMQKPTHFYIRRPDEASHKNYEYLLSPIHTLHP